MSDVSLNWEASHAIALELMRRYADANIEEVSLQQIYDWTVALEDFDDDPALANDEILQAIYQDWFEEHIHGQ